MIAEIIASLFLLVENCTSVFVVKAFDQANSRELEEPLIERQHDLLEEFTKFDPNDVVYQEYDPPEGFEADPKAWKRNLPSKKKTLYDCLKSVLLIQTISGSLIGLFTVGIIILDFIFGEWCSNVTDHWDHLPKNVQNLRVTAQAVEGAIIQMWNLLCMVSIFPLSLFKELQLLVLNTLVVFLDVTYRIYMQMIGLYGASWKSYPLNVLFLSTLLVNNYLLARKYYPTSLKGTFKLTFILSAQFLLGQPASLLAFHCLFPWFFRQPDHIKVIIAILSPLLTVIPKIVTRLGAQALDGIIHPGTGFALVSSVYAATAIVFRVLQSDIITLKLFIALGIAHSAIDLVERITVTMRDQIWDYLYRLVRRGRRPKRKHISLRSRRFVADITIQIILQEATALVGSLGFMTIYQILYTHDKPVTNKDVLIGFFTRVGFGLLIDLVFNTVSLFIIMRLMNIAVRRVWKVKWRYHIVVNAIIVCITVTYFSEYLFKVVQNKYSNIHLRQNCTYPNFL